MISYYSQVKNRFFQFKKTFRHNLGHISSHNETEWIIVDCGSNDGIYEYVSKIKLPERVKYYRTVNYSNYSIPVAKNFAARLSSGDYLFNLDIDNYIGNTTDKVIDLGFGGVCCEIFKIGVYGRIGCSSEIFKKVGGYDESFLPAGKHDMDFMKRCNLLNYKFQHISCDINPILNSKKDTVINSNSNMNWETMNILNGKKMLHNLQHQIYHPNQKFTRCDFEYNFTATVKLSEEFV